MSNLIFPSTLKGFDIKVGRSPVFGTLVQTATSGKELRASFEAWPRYRYTLQLNFVREAGFSIKALQDETANLNRFFQIHLGSWDSFLFQDPLDYTVTGMGFGVGDNTTTAFQLQRTLAGQITDTLGTWPAYSTPRTNLCIQSQTLQTGWSTTISGTGVAPTVTANYALAPDGTPTADRVQINQGAGTTGSDYSFLTTPTISGVTIGQTYTLSIWMKSNTGSNQTIVLGYGSLMGSFQVVTVTPSWQRFTMNFTAAATSGVTNLGLRGTVTTGSTADISAWGVQVEAGSTATRYIPTTTATVTVNPSYYPASGDGFEPVFELDPSNPLLIYVNGTLKANGTDYTVSNGIVTFTAAPAANAVLTWTGNYFRRVRFDGDSIELERMVSGAWDGKTVKLITVK